MYLVFLVMLLSNVLQGKWKAVMNWVTGCLRFQKLHSNSYHMLWLGGHSKYQLCFPGVMDKKGKENVFREPANHISPGTTVVTTYNSDI